jgi:hypothetical protein
MSPTLKKLAKRIAILAAAGLLLTQMLPSLADQLTPNPVVETSAPDASAQVSPEPSASASASASLSAPAEPVADVTYLATESPTAKAKVIESDSLFFQIPNTLKVDPRATSMRIDSFALGGSDDLQMCIASNRASLSLSSSENVLADGIGSRSLLISGTPRKVLAALTSGHGLILSTVGRLSGTIVTFQAVALTKPSVDPELCGASQITRSVSVTTLGIDLNTVKTPVKIGKK